MVFPKATPRGVVACGGMTGGVLVEARILGRIELVSGGVRLSLGGTKQRAVLAMLVLEANLWCPPTFLLMGCGGILRPPER